ncbi:hypothetical protein KSC_098020 [Ktedonobacter sp. SOSP1-52]|nr:hypothetical protein KSC_098020 [Ktedonobacter sp. SOSP1-52]
MLRNGVNSLQAQAMRFVIFWHILKTIAIDAPVIQSVIDIVHNRNFVRLVPVILRQQTITNRLHQARLLGQEEANGRNLLNAC